jgi:hypothetical protein
MANNSTNINKTKESLNIDGQQFINVKALFCFVDIGGIVGHQCLNFLLFC